MPVIGFLNSQPPDTYADRLRAFHRGLKDTDYVESENVTILYRWAENQLDRLPELAADLVRRRVAPPEVPLPIVAGTNRGLVSFHGAI
jgi:putative ABC transport system substrate-binding protein